MEIITLFGILELTLDCTGAGTAYLSTDLPGDLMAVQETKQITTTTTRRVFRWRLKPSTKGRLYRLKVVPTGSAIIRLYGGRLWARPITVASGYNEQMAPGWQWFAIPIPATPEEWAAVPLPIPETPVDFAAVPLPIPETPVEFSPLPLPIPPTSEEWTSAQLPIKETPANPEWVDIAVDA